MNMWPRKARYLVYCELSSTTSVQYMSLCVAVCIFFTYFKFILILSPPPLACIQLFHECRASALWGNSLSLMKVASKICAWDMCVCLCVCVCVCVCVYIYIYTHTYPTHIFWRQPSLIYIYIYIYYIKSGGKQWQGTPKNLPRMQRPRAIPVA